MRVQLHTAQMWADNFITELNDTHVEAELRTKHIPPQLNVDRCVGDFASARRRLLVLGYNATLTTSVDTSRLPKRQQYDQYSVRHCGGVSSVWWWVLTSTWWVLASVMVGACVNRRWSRGTTGVERRGYGCAISVQRYTPRYNP